MTMATAAAAAIATLRKGPLAVGSDETPGPRGGLGGAPRPVPTLRSDSRLVDDSRELHAVHARVVFLQRSLRVSSDRRWCHGGFVGGLPMLERCTAERLGAGNGEATGAIVRP
jgi:hypothetical protein